MHASERIDEVLDVADRHAAEVDRDARFPHETVSALSGAGLLALTIPEDVGGSGGSAVEFVDVVSQLAAHCASSAMVYLMHICAVQVILAAPPADERVLDGIKGGRHLSTLAFSEKGSRSHFWAPVSKLQNGQGPMMLRAEKSFVTSAGRADSYVVSTQAAAANAPTETSLFLVPAGRSGIEVGKPWDGLGLRGNASAPMSLEVKVDEGMRLGPEGQGFQLMLGVVLPWFQLGSAAVSLGLATAAVRSTVDHVSRARLEHLEQRLADLPTIRARLGRMEVAVEATTGFLADAARRFAAADADAPILASKAAANEMAVRVTDEAMQACGGAAFSKALPLERYFRDARAGSIMAPTTDVLYELIARSLVGMELL